MKKRILAALLAALLLVGMIGCSAQPTEAEESAPVTEELSDSAEIGAGEEAVDGVETDAEADTAGTAEAQRIVELQQPRKTQMQAYGEIVQKLVNRYGLVDDEKAQYGEGNPQPAGVNGVFLYDLTGDGSEELIVVYSEGTASSDAMDNNIVLLVYTYERERAVSLLKYDHVLFDSGVSNISICSMDGRYLISTGSTRYFAEHIFYAQDGEIQDAMDSQEPYSAAEQAIYDEGIQYGLSGEAEAIQRIYLKRAGFSGENLQYLDGVSSDMGFWLCAKNPEQFSETLERLGVKLPKELVSADRLLQEISYYGDPTL